MLGERRCQSGGTLMKIVQVERPLVSTNRIAEMEHKHLQVVRDGSSLAVAVDAGRRAVETGPGNRDRRSPRLTTRRRAAMVPRVSC